MFQNTRIIWLLYKRWQNSIHKSNATNPLKKKNKKKNQNKSTIKLLSTTKSLSLQVFSTSGAVKDHPLVGASVGGSDRDQSKAMFSSCLPHFTPRVMFGRKAAPFQFQTLGRREEGLLVGCFFFLLSVCRLKTTLKSSHQLHVGFL